jgi:hypothetical protein
MTKIMETHLEDDEVVEDERWCPKR